MIGFGCLGHSNVFCRRSPYLSNDINIDGDKVMDIQIKEGDLIGCYCTKDYLYFTLNGILTQFRISYMTLKTYIPIVCIDHDDIELKIFKNISIIDHSNKKYDFLNICKYCSKYFQGKDIDSSVQINKEDDTNNSFIEQNNFLIGQIVKLNQMNINEFDIESNYIQPQSFQYYQESFGIIKDINTGNDNKYVSKMTLESFNNIKLSKETINFEIDSRFLAKQKTNFFNLIENRMNVKFGFNSTFDLDYLPEKLQKSCDLNSIKLFLKNKTINDNSKSISILMVRYLVFILVDFLRYSKSTLLQEKDSKESQSIIQYLAYSLPTITVFNPVFEFSIDDITINDYLIFPDKNLQRSSCKIPGLSSCFHYSFIAFLKKGTNIISQEFMLDLIQKLFDIKNQNNSNSLSIFYDMIASKYKIESLFPLPRIFNYKLEIEKFKFCDEANQNDVVGFIQILLSTIPDELPCAICGKRGLRISSNKISYFAHINQDFSIKWKYDIEKLKEIELSEINVNDFNDFKLQLGIFLLNYNLQENLLNGALGFVQIIFILFHSFINLKKNKNLIKSIIDKLFIISQEKNALVNPFLKEIFVYFIIQEGFSDLFLTKEASNFFSNLSIKDNPYQIDKYNNKSSIIFNLFSNLFNIRETELSITNNKNEEELSLLFDKYYEINNELFKIYNDDIEDNYLKIEGKMKKSDLTNYQIFYLLFYYSILLRRENITPYPMFLFVHEYIRQHFGGFSFKVNHKNYNNDDSNKILYHSDMLINDFDLECSFKLINSYGYELDYYKYDIFVQQNEDNKKIELIEGEKVFVSFPLDILINNKRQKEKKLKNGDTFIINFEPSKEQQKKYFITHYDEILEAFKQYISLEKYDNELSQYLFSLKKKREFPYYNDDVFSFPSVGNHLDFEGNDNFENLYEENNQHDIRDPNELNGRLYNEIARIIASNIDFFNTHRHNHANRWNIFHHLIDFDNSNIQINTEFKYIFTHQKIPKVIDIKLKYESFNQLIISLRYYILASYIRFIKKLMKNEDFFNSDSLNALSIWDISISDKKDSQKFYINQIIHPLYSLDTKNKFKFIQKYIENNTTNTSKLSIKMNRFEQQKFMKAIENNNKEQIIKESSLPLLFQFMKQVDEKSLYQLKIPNNTPFSVKLIGENAIDAGGPGREIFSSLMIEMMNYHIGIFTFNPNRQHNIKETNQEDLIPFVNANCYDESLMKQFSNRFVYAGSLIAVCITSKLPQPIKLSSIIWEYLTHESVSIESIYEIDYNFKKLIENAENAFNKANASDLSKEEFESLFLHAFDINDSFDNIIELIPSGSNQLVTKENLKNFIQLAKNFRIHEFDQQLIDLKKGFDIVMCNKNITSILNPNELKLFVCGEPNCDIEQMKQLIRVSVTTKKDVDKEKIIQMFWNVIESFSVEERMKFIRFSSGNLGLPAPGLKWNDYLNVNIVSMFYSNKLAHASTCSSTITIPLFENEEELEKILRISIENSFLITDSHENFEIISEFL